MESDLGMLVKWKDSKNERNDGGKLLSWNLALSKKVVGKWFYVK